MSQVDSGLGWSCDSAYYANDAGMYLGEVNGTPYYKKNTGPAIVLAQDYIIGGRKDYYIIVFSSNLAYTLCDKDAFDSYMYHVDGIDFYGLFYRPNDYPESFSSPFPSSHSNRGYVQLAESGLITYVSSQTIPVQFVRQGRVLQDTFDITVRGSMA